LFFNLSTRFHSSCWVNKPARQDGKDLTGLILPQAPATIKSRKPNGLQHFFAQNWAYSYSFSVSYKCFYYSTKIKYVRNCPTQRQTFCEPRTGLHYTTLPLTLGPPSRSHYSNDCSISQLETPAHSHEIVANSPTYSILFLF
jgi:hypothetical protein